MENALNPWQVGQEVQLEVEKAILGGKFLGSASDGRVAWLKSVQALAIGDLVTAKVLKSAKRSYELEVQNINQEGSIRNAPFCPHIQQCGGCPWQAVPTEQQIQSLSRDIDRMLSRAVGHEVKWLSPYMESKQAWRHTARLHSDGKGRLGFYGPQGLLDLTHCPVFVPTLN
jgi:23S rRNA (uracil1939-C5)-methyltransferase